MKHKRGFDWIGWILGTLVTFLEATGLLVLSFLAAFAASCFLLTVTGTWWFVELILQILSIGG